MSPEEKAHVHSIAALYDIAGPIDVTRVNGLHASRVYRLRDKASGKDFALRIPTDFDHRTVANEAEITKQLRNRSGLTTPSLLRNKDHALWFSEHGGWSGTIATWLEGMHPTPDGIDNKMCELLGKSLATFHVYVKLLPYNVDHKLLPDDVEQWLNEHGHGGQDADGSHIKKIMELKSAVLPRGIVHGDFHANNILINASKVGILDMERSGEGILLFDVARAAIDICRIEGAIDSHKLNHFISGYEQVRHLSEHEREYFGAAMQYALLVVSEWFRNRGYQDAVKDLSLAHSSLQKMVGVFL